MTLRGRILWMTLFAATLGGVYTGQTGFFVPPPTKDPVSVREASARGGKSNTRVRYFRGGGVHHGK